VAIMCTCRGGCTKSSTRGKLDFPRGYHIEFRHWGAACPDSGAAQGLEQFTGGSYGKAFKADARRYYGSRNQLRRDEAR